MIWKRLIDIYGQRFTKQHGQVGGEGFNIWCRELNGLSKQDIEHGLHELENRVEQAFRNGITAYPPSAIEFRSICKPVSVPASHRPYRPALPEPQEIKIERITRGQSHLSALRNLLG